MSFLLSAGFSTEIALTEIAEKIGIEKTLSLVPKYPVEAPHIFDDTVSIYNKPILPNLDSIKQILDIDKSIFSKNNQKENSGKDYTCMSNNSININKIISKVNKLINKTSVCVGSSAWL